MPESPPELDFQVHGVEIARHAVAPLLLLKLHVSVAAITEAIQNVVLQCQIQINTSRRTYAPDEQQRLVELFAEPARWGTTVRTLLWTHTNLVLPPFEDSCEVDLPLPCSYDFNLAATKYFDALEGEVPITLLFSGSIFYRTASGALQVGQISWNKEAAFRLPVKVWREMMEHYYPNSAWLCLRKDLFDRLSQYKTRAGISTWERALERLLGNDSSMPAQQQEKVQCKQATHTPA